MTGRPPRTSRQFAAIRALRARLREQAFPAHHVTGESVKLPVGYADSPDAGAERIWISLNLDETRTKWTRANPPGRDEEFVADVWIMTDVPARSEEQAFDRLEVLSDIVQLCVYDDVAQAVRPLGFTGEVQTARVGEHRFSVAKGADGYVGRAGVSFHFETRI